MWCIGHRNLVRDPFCRKEVCELLIYEFAASIGAYLPRHAWILLLDVLYDLQVYEGFILGLKEGYEVHSRLFVHSM